MRSAQRYLAGPGEAGRGRAVEGASEPAPQLPRESGASCRFGAQSPLASAAPAESRGAGEQGTAGRGHRPGHRARLSLGPGGVWAGVAMAAASRGGSPTPGRPPAAGELGRSEVCSEWTEPRAPERRGGLARGPVPRPHPPRRVGARNPPGGQRRRPSLLGVPAGARRSTGGGTLERAEPRDCRPCPGVPVCVSVDLTFYTPQPPTEPGSTSQP